MIQLRADQYQPPQESDYLAAVFGVNNQLHRDEANVHAVIANYANRRRQSSIAMARFVDRFGNIGLGLEDFDSQTGEFVDQNLNTANAFMDGVATGAMIINTVHKGQVTVGAIADRMPAFDDCEDGDDAIELRYKLVNHVVDRGGQGLALMGPIARDVLYSLEREDAFDTSQPYMFRAGCGTVVLAAAGIHRAIDQVKFTKSLAGAHDFDWSQGLDRLVAATNLPPAE